MVPRTEAVVPELCGEDVLVFRSVARRKMVSKVRHGSWTQVQGLLQTWFVTGADRCPLRT